jgi:deoxyribose-phosphate aldolase
MVINIGALRSREYTRVLKDIVAVRKAARGKVLKVIIEAGLLTDSEKIKACKLAKNAGADFVKTSTGFVSGATASDIRLMRKAVGPSMGIKASGGIKTAGNIFEMIDAGATRIGTSAAVYIIKAAKGGTR